MSEPPKTEAEWVAALLQHGGNATVIAAGWRRIAYESINIDNRIPKRCLIPLREAFRRWKIARKAWETRKAKQLEMPL